MKISIAMATYNGEMYLQPQLRSIAEQLRLPDEVVICDDGSTDRTGEIVRDFAASAPFLVRVHENPTSQGPIENFQRAVELCDGDIIVLCDQDDCWRPEKLIRIEETFSSSPKAGLLFSDAELIDQDGHSINRRLWQYTFKAKYQKQIRTGKAFELLLQRHVVTGAAMAFRQSFREMILPLPTDIPLIHDGWIALIIAAISDVAMLPEPLISYRLHPGQYLGIEPFKQRLPENKSKDSSSLARRSEYYLGEIRKLRTVQKRLAVIGNRGGDPNLRERLQSRTDYLEKLLTHLLARSGLPEGRLGRGQIVLGELLTFRYHRYSRGLLSALRDLSI
jgi:glycosyltransferase involved in cell wall biosynthesis